MERTVQIKNKFGLHARPAAEFVKVANRFAADVTASKDETVVNGKSIMGVMMLAAECGSEIVLRAQGADAEEALQALVELIDRRFGEE